MLQKSTLDFLRKLKKNNKREWFNANKQLYEDAKYDFEKFAGDMIDVICKFDKSLMGLDPKDCMFRIYRDVRFSKDKSPYKKNMGAVMYEGGRNSTKAGYYFHLAPGGCFFAGGMHMPGPDQLLLIRQAIYGRFKEFQKILNDKEYKKYFDGIEGEKLKTAPKGFPKDHPSTEYLKYKGFIAYSEIEDTKVLSKSFTDIASKVFKAMKPLLDFLNKSQNPDYQ
jgi:uncharacterized protein (TIGR02453 family)